MQRYASLLLLIALLWIPGISISAGLSFPSENKEISDPSGRYAIIWKSGNITEEKPHRLFLKDLSIGRLTKLLDFYRQVDVLWAPDGRHVTVTDWTGSNVSEVSLFKPGKKRAINLADALYRSFGQQAEIANSAHVYFEALSWSGSKRLIFKVFGNGTPGGKEFERQFEFSVSGKVREVKPR